MKKISRLFFSVASAALISLSFFACSEPATDDNSFDPFDSIPENPPAAVGEDPFKGKTIASDENKFIFNTDGTCKKVNTDLSLNDAYKYKYSYNTEKKELYLLPQSVLIEGKLFTSAQDLVDYYKPSALSHYPDAPQEWIDYYSQLDGSICFALQTYFYEISSSSVTLTVKPEVGPTTFSNDRVWFMFNAFQFAVEDGYCQAKANINKTQKKISFSKVWLTNSDSVKEEACKFVASYTENKSNGTITLKVLEKSDNLSFVPDTTVLEANLNGSRVKTYTFE